MKPSKKTKPQPANERKVTRPKSSSKQSAEPEVVRPDIFKFSMTKPVDESIPEPKRKPKKPYSKARGSRQSYTEWVNHEWHEQVYSDNVRQPFSDSSGGQS